MNLKERVHLQEYEFKLYVLKMGKLSHFFYGNIKK